MPKTPQASFGDRSTVTASTGARRTARPRVARADPSTASGQHLVAPDLPLAAGWLTVSRVSSTTAVVSSTVSVTSGRASSTTSTTGSRTGGTSRSTGPTAGAGADDADRRIGPTTRAGAGGRRVGRRWRPAGRRRCRWARRGPGGRLPAPGTVVPAVTATAVAPPAPGPTRRRHVEPARAGRGPARRRRSLAQRRWVGGRVGRRARTGVGDGHGLRHDRPGRARWSPGA